MEEEANIKKKFGLRIRALRDERDWSQMDLSHASLVDAGYIGKIERGEVSCSLVKMAALARAFNLELWELLKY